MKSSKNETTSVLGRPKILEIGSVKKSRTFTLSDEDMELFQVVKKGLAQEGYFDANNSAIVRAALKNFTWLPDSEMLKFIKEYS